MATGSGSRNGPGAGPSLPPDAWSPSLSCSPYIVWGPELSPYLLKLEAMLARAGVSFLRLPRDGTRAENFRLTLLLQRAKRRGTALRLPANDPLDEYPLVPFLVTPDRQVLYDSTALAAWIDQKFPNPSGPLVPAEPAVAFAARLIDEAFDEFGLYMVHHNRWKLAALNNGRPGARLAAEFATQFPPLLGGIIGAWFERRQVRRLPYLFSVAPTGYRVDGLPRALTPPARAGFPPTHDLLEQAWERFLAATESILSEQRFLLGGHFTLADASAYGQLSMNLTDTLAAKRLKELAPKTFAWLEGIRDRNHVASLGVLELTTTLAPLLDVILETFVPLMKSNAAAWSELHAAGERCFNERGFDAGLGLYDGELLGHPFRAVAKTFQVRCWKELCGEWQRLGPQDRARVEGHAPCRNWEELFEGPMPSHT